MTTEQKLEDFRYLFEIFRENHPYLSLKKRVEGYDWLAMKDEFERTIRETEDDEEFATAMNRILLLVNNAHTRMATSVATPAEQIGLCPVKAEYWLRLATGSSWRYFHLPFRAQYFDGKYIVTEVTEHHLEGIKIGSQVASIEGIPVHEFVASLRGTCYLPYDQMNKTVFMPDLSLPTSQTAWQITFETGDSPEQISLEVPFLKEWRRGPQPAHLPPRYRHKGEEHDLGGGESLGYTAFLNDGNVGYIHIHSMRPNSSDLLKMIRFFNSAKDTEALIIDIRGNGGGSRDYWKEVVSRITPAPITYSWAASIRGGEYIRKYTRELPAIDKEELWSQLDESERVSVAPEIFSEDFLDPVIVTETIYPCCSSMNYRGKIFLLVDHRSYSAAEEMAMFCKATGWATLVGTPAGGDGLNPTTMIPVVLPNSGMVILFPAAMGLNPDWSANEEIHTVPDVTVDLSGPHIDWIKDSAKEEIENLDPKYDPALRVCLELIGR